MDNPEAASILQVMNFDTDILIVGGGLNGPALALALAQTGQHVTVIDALTEKVRKNATFDGRSYALALASQRLLAAIGIWPAVSDKAQPILEINVSDGHAGSGSSPLFMHFDYAEIEEGPMGYMVEDRYLRRAFLDAIDANDRIAHVSGRTVIDQSADASGVRVTLDDGSEMAARLLVGADGRSSGTARRAGIKRIGWAYGQTALVCAVKHEKPHNGTAYQFFMPSGPLAILPLTGNRSSIVWSERTDMAQKTSAMDNSGYLQALRPRFGDFLGEISLAGKRFSYPLSSAWPTATSPSASFWLATRRTVFTRSPARG